LADGGRLRPHTDARTPTPDLAAGRALATALGVPAVPVHRGAAPVGGRRLGAVHSAPLATLVEQCLQASDNVLAEALARLVAGAGGEPASFAGAAAAVAARLTTLGVDLTGTRLVDGSGLSRADRLTPRLLVGVLAAAASGRHPQLRPVLSGLPVAGFSGTLDDRFVTGPARLAAGQVRAKTGTLSGVSTLAGITVDADGRLLAFAVLADRVPVGGTRAAEAALDRVAARLARCGCR
jgi:D-alanyl-D-alanine carboxypeptidase/D-alanyl-D-alanine-endopeptidase (penicillin-binding protein 4)